MNTKEWNEQARLLIGKAVLAPSSHNTQPWIFQISQSVIDLHADRTRALPVNDPDDRELVISCGCALLNLRIAAASDGLGTRVELFPDPAQPDWLARVSFTDQSGASTEGALLAEFVERRRTYRKRFASRDAAVMG
jgi:nitroreductase